MMHPILKAGDIGFYNSNSLLAKIIHFFTKQSWEPGDPVVIHSLLITLPIDNNETVEEADLLVQVVPFQKFYRDLTGISYYIYRIKGPYTDEQVTEALNYAFTEFAGEHYGYTNLLWFVYRWFANKFGYNVDRQKNWMTNGVICSELVWYYLNHLGGKAADLIKEFDPDTVQSQDLMTIVMDNPDVFELVEKKEKQ